VLSTPNLMTLDNEEAKIVIGNNVPFVTGSYANTGGNSGAVNPFNTVERKDVGLMLRVRPQISENGTVKLTLYQEISKVAEATLNNTNGPSTSKRSIESTVLVDDGKIRTTLTEKLSPINAANLKTVHALIESGAARGKIVLEGF
jgi:general secretion pathway protein D